LNSERFGTSVVSSRNSVWVVSSEIDVIVDVAWTSLSTALRSSCIDVGGSFRLDSEFGLEPPDSVSRFGSVFGGSVSAVELSVSVVVTPLVVAVVVVVTVGVAVVRKFGKGVAKKVVFGTKKVVVVVVVVTVSVVVSVKSGSFIRPSRSVWMFNISFEVCVVTASFWTGLSLVFIVKNGVIVTTLASDVVVVVVEVVVVVVEVVTIPIPRLLNGADRSKTG
jgi:hypothetical protein